MGSLPALIRYYVRIGLLTCGRPFYDPEFDECFLPLVGTPDTLLTVKFCGRTIKE
ncbi:hypothetical protein GCM10011390_20710 [Aureimonas endophytica]|uniref:Uncharacterized protein n=1 Tax=Aureimonas endophytica TaxID=2027858 RepID=A0A916ZKK7_9HYPH|nr:hypothetical protein [Aureimonas endophytica]GGE01671.1 hypothetical protein GCM10011390_20710 [Aureimonas endophytica]